MPSSRLIAVPALVRRRRRRMNLALQGGGAHGAFTWGALDRLLEEEALRIDGVSGTSAGAVNAVALAAGLMEGGREGARAKLAEIWHAIGKAGSPGVSLPRPFSLLAGAETSRAALHAGLKGLNRVWSPYEFNPLDINPMRDILSGSIDFPRLQRGSPVKLFIAATEVSSGRARIFRTSEITADCVLASACLPNLFAAVKIGRFHYWDGGYSANPDLITLIAESRAGDTLLVQLSPHRNPRLPVTAPDITGNVSRITFNQPLRHQVEVIERCRRAAGFCGRVGAGERRLQRHRFHLIEAERHTQRLNEDSKLKPDRDLLRQLHEGGRAEAELWLQAEQRHIGRRSSVDLFDRLFESRLPFD